MNTEEIFIEGYDSHEFNQLANRRHSNQHLNRNPNKFFTFSKNDKNLRQLSSERRYKRSRTTQELDEPKPPTNMHLLNTLMDETSDFQKTENSNKNFSIENFSKKNPTKK